MLLALSAALPYGCGDPGGASPMGEASSGGSGDERVVIGFGVLVEGDPGRTYRSYQPLADFLTERTPYLVQLRVAGSASDLLRNLEERMAELAPLDIVSYLDASAAFGAVPFARTLDRNGEPLQRSVFVVRHDSAIERLADLRGRKLALGNVHSTSSHLLPRHELQLLGLGAGEVRLELFDDDEAVWSAVEEGRVDAGALSGDVAHARLDADANGDENEDDREGLKVIHVSKAVSSPPLAVRDDLPESVTAAIAAALLELDPESSGRRESWDAAIRFGFAPATASDYDAVRAMAAELNGTCAQGCHAEGSAP